MASTSVKRTKHRWSLADGRSGDLVLAWTLTQNRLACVSMTLSCDDSASIDVRDLRMMRLGEAWDEGRGRVSPHFLQLGIDHSQIDAVVRDAFTTDQRSPRPGRQALSEEHFRDVAGMYTALLKVSNSPTSDLARHYEVSQPTAARWIGRARKLGFLPKTTPGRSRPAVETPDV